MSNNESARDLDGVLGTALAVAQEQLTEHGGIMPFAVVLENEAATARRVAEDNDAPEDGEPSLRMVLVAPEGDEDDDLDGNEVVEALLSSLREQRTDLTAVAVVSDVTLLEGGSDAIHVEAEHVDGQLAGLLQPYKLDGETPEWGELMGDDPEAARVWAE